MRNDERDIPQCVTFAIIVAGGKGLRMGGPLPKQFIEVGGRPILMHTIDRFREALPGVSVVLVLPRGQQGFWAELCGAVRKEVKPPAFGFFSSGPSAPVQPSLTEGDLRLMCGNTFVAETIDKPDILEVVSRKAAAILGRPVRVKVIDRSARPAGDPRMEQLMNFGRAHSDIIKIKNS